MLASHLEMPPSLGRRMCENKRVYTTLYAECTNRNCGPVRITRLRASTDSGTAM